MHGRRPKSARCLFCKKRFTLRSRGRIPRYCSPAHRQRAYELRKWRRPTLVALADDLRQIREKDRIRAAVREFFAEAGIILPPPPVREPKSKKSRFTVIDGDAGSPGDEQ